ncbi:MAG: hypothetical protein ACI92G_003480, partial [Candidatus Pelagisphaera sp.]
RGRSGAKKRNKGSAAASAMPPYLSPLNAMRALAHDATGAAAV